MVLITEIELKKRAEHNDGRLFDLEEQCCNDNSTKIYVEGSVTDCMSGTCINCPLH